ncbi:MAG: OmpA family protein [Candidatus Acidiferrum sp.]
MKLLQQNPDLKLRVEGHTDNQGNAAANQSLSEKRAQAVVAWLRAHGVEAGRLTAKGWVRPSQSKTTPRKMGVRRTGASNS